jgi:hypothetical protein
VPCVLEDACGHPTTSNTIHIYFSGVAMYSSSMQYANSHNGWVPCAITHIIIMTSALRAAGALAPALAALALSLSQTDSNRWVGKLRCNLHIYIIQLEMGGWIGEGIHHIEHQFACVFFSCALSLVPPGIGPPYRAATSFVPCPYTPPLPR